ncbi:adenylate/guanylate cyclase domain-containing protein [Muriicola sp. SD30]|uniref:adenylate/guanylate cyclase domain-containing protein n=1 Tax=Muriicola sp. SD30 TaxID=3240936 RepID=UPI00350F0FE3
MQLIDKSIMLILSILLLFGSGQSIAQRSAIDSLKNQVATGIRDTNKVRNLNELSIAVLMEGEIEESMRLSKQSIELAEQLNYQIGEAYGEKNMGLAYYYQGDYKKVLSHWSRSLEIFEGIDDAQGISNLSSNLGAVYYSQGSNTRALDLYLRSLNFAEKIKDSLRIASVLLNIGGLYADNPNDYDKALDYFNRIPPYLPSLNNPQITTGYLMGVGEVYLLQGRYEKAMGYYKQALELTYGTQDYSGNLTKLGIVEHKMGDRSQAIDYLNLALSNARENNQQLHIVHALTELGNVYQEFTFDKALKSYKEAETLANEMQTQFELKEIYKGLSSAYARQGDYENAYAYQTLQMGKKDSLFNLETDDKIRGLQFEFEIDKKQDELVSAQQELQISELETKRQQYVIYGTVLGLLLVFVLAVGSYKRYRYVNKTNKIIAEEKDRSDKLLLNILPEETAQELKQHGKVAAKKFDSVTILFSDFKGFTSHAQNLNPEILVKSVDYYFSRFDEIMDKYGLEKIKTVGDAYMCAGGLPFPTSDHPFKMVEAAFEMAAVMEEIKTNPKEDIVPFDVRIGINTGTVVAGVVGLNKFAYDIWGDAVNVASRMETLSDPGRINISENTYEIIKNVYECEPRGEVEVKNKGMMAMYFVKGRKIIRHAKSEKEVNA